MQAGAVAVGYSPKFWLDAGVSRVVGSPQQVNNLFKGVELPRRFECLEVGGAPLNTHMSNLFLMHFDKVIDSYGAVETSKSYENIYTKVSGAISVAGRPVDSDVEIVDERGCPVPVGTPGTLRVRNAHIADGYLLKTGFAAVRSEVDGWFYPGDIAAWGGNGTLKVLGRIDQVINIGGAKILAGELEAYVNQFAYICDTAVVQFLYSSDISCLKILVEVDGTKELSSLFENICRYAAKEKGILIMRDNFIVANKIPRNINGKIDVSRCVELAKSQLVAS
jgi:acyl-coenzyme A synthetase/AMP-(fatty) acid ligase